MQEAFPSNFQFNNGGSTFGNSTSIFDGNNFEQKSFTFGKKSGRFYDKPRQGFSREPFINKKSNIPDLDKGPSRFLGFIDSFSDGFIRGGEQNALKRAALDNLRINRFFLTGRGLTFIDNQKALQKSNPVIQEGGPPTAANVLGVASAVPGPQQPILAGLATLFCAGNLV